MKNQKSKSLTLLYNIRKYFKELPIVSDFKRGEEKVRLQLHYYNNVFWRVWEYFINLIQLIKNSQHVTCKYL